MRTRRVSLALFAMLAAVAAVGPVLAHARLLATIPAANAQLSGSPQSLTLTFDQPVRLAVLKLATAGHVVPVTVDRQAAAASSVTLPLPPLASGAYEVEWSAVTSGDGHVVKGAYSFVVR